MSQEKRKKIVSVLKLVPFVSVAIFFLWIAIGGLILVWLSFQLQPSNIKEAAEKLSYLTSYYTAFSFPFVGLVLFLDLSCLLIWYFMDSPKYSPQ